MGDADSRDRAIPVMQPEELPPPAPPGPSLVAIGCALLIAVSVTVFALLAWEAASLLWGHWSFG